MTVSYPFMRYTLFCVNRLADRHIAIASGIIVGLLYGATSTSDVSIKSCEQKLF